MGSPPQSDEFASVGGVTVISAYPASHDGPERNAVVAHFPWAPDLRIRPVALTPWLSVRYAFAPNGARQSICTNHIHRRGFECSD